MSTMPLPVKVNGEAPLREYVNVPPVIAIGSAWTDNGSDRKINKDAKGRNSLMVLKDDILRAVVKRRWSAGS